MEADWLGQRERRVLVDDVRCPRFIPDGYCPERMSRGLRPLDPKKRGNDVKIQGASVRAMRNPMLLSR